MRPKKEERILAEALRRDHGLSYREIAGITGVSKSTLSSWLRDIPLSPEGRTRLQERLRANRATFAARAWPINRARYQQARDQAYQKGAQVVSKLSGTDALRELALAMLYLGEGSKTGGRVQLASTKPDILRYFMKELLSLYAIDESRLTFRLNLVEPARSIEEKHKRWWIEKLGCPHARFIKTQFDPRVKIQQIGNDYHGVCTLTYNDTYLQQRILGLAYTFIQSQGNNKSHQNT